MSWVIERLGVLGAWPHVFGDNSARASLPGEDLHAQAWGCSNELDWRAWLVQTRGLNEIMGWGPTVGHAMRSEGSNRSLVAWGQRMPLMSQSGAMAVQDADIQALIARLQRDLSVRAVVVARSASVEWAKKQLTDAYWGLSRLADVLGCPQESVGGRRMILWLHEHTPGAGIVAGHSHPDVLEVHRHGGNAAQAWAAWALGAPGRTGIRGWPDAARSWRRSWPHSPRSILAHQEQFLSKSQRSFKACMDCAPVTTDMGEKMFRRYRAVCKWMDELQRGVGRDTIQQNWGKVKTGTRITWAGGLGAAHQAVTSNWLWEERLVEQAFWHAPQWHVPAWVQRAMALAHDSWPRDMADMDEGMLVALWALGIEAIVRQQMGHDSWLATQHLCHPDGVELDAFSQFYHDRLAACLI